MKKGLIILFTFYFFLSSVGIVLGKHSCGNKTSYTAWGIPVTETKTCKCKHKESVTEHKKNCCKSNTHWVKCTTSDSKIQLGQEVSKNNHAIINSYVIDLFYSVTKKEYRAYDVFHSPPISGIPIFLKNRILLI